MCIFRIYSKTLHFQPRSALNYQKEHRTWAELFNTPWTPPRCFTLSRPSWLERQISGKQVLRRRMNRAITVPDKEKQAESFAVQWVICEIVGINPNRLKAGASGSELTMEHAFWWFDIIVNNGWAARREACIIKLNCETKGPLKGTVVSLELGYYVLVARLIAAPSRLYKSTLISS